MAEERGFWDGFFHEFVYPALSIIGTCTIIAYAGGLIQFTPQKSTIPDAIAQPAPSRTWTRENLLRKLMQEHPEEFTTEIDGYSITPRAMEYLREEDTGIVTLVRRDSTGQATLEPDIIIPFKTAMVGRAATIAGDSIITYPTIVQAHKEYMKDLWGLSQREKQ